jgi:hypothetical protein
MPDNQGQYNFSRQAIVSVFVIIGRSAHKLNEYVQKADVDSSKRVRVTTDVADKLKER